MQVYNCSFGEPLDAVMFQARIYDPNQPNICTNLNAIINPRVTMLLEVPEYQTNRLFERSDDLVLRRKKRRAYRCREPASASSRLGRTDGVLD